MNLDNLRNEMALRGIAGSEVTIMKNGIPCQGIRIIDPNGSNVCPVIYYSENETVEHFMERIRECMASGIPTFREEELAEWSFIKRNAYVGIQRKSDDNDLLKRDYLNLELYIGVRVEIDSSKSYGSFKITRNLMEVLGRGEDDFWNAAIENSKAQFHIRSMSEMLGFIGESPMYVVTAELNSNGAAALAFPNVFDTFCIEHNEDSVYILPSSREDLILLGESVVRNEFSEDSLAQLVRSVNDEVVDPQIALDPVVYKYTLGEGAVTIAARA